MNQTNHINHTDHINEKINIAGSGIAFASGGALIGSAIGGPVGGFVGAFVGMVSGVASEIISERERASVSGEPKNKR